MKTVLSRFTSAFLRFAQYKLLAQIEKKLKK